MRAIYLILAAAGVTLAGCSTREARPATNVPAARTPEHALAVSSANFVAANGSIDLFVIRSSEMALQRSASARLRDFATRMIADHRGTSGQLSLAGRRLNLLPSATLSASEQSTLDALSVSANFDADYVRAQRLAHQRAIALDSGFAASGQSPTLRPVASSALRIEESHLRLLAYL